MPYSNAEAIFESMCRVNLLPESRDLVTHITERIFVENYLFGGKNNGKTKGFSDEIANAIQYLTENLDKKIDIDELAKSVFLSHNGLLWKFRQELNTTPSNYLYLLRMQNAKRLLLDCVYSISEIAEMCGYQNPYYFTNAFHKYSGMSPSEFRKRYLKY